MNFFSELKRRNVFKVGLAYTVASWLLLQIVDLVLENINAPDWVMQVFMLAMAVGFPIALIIAWAFELTPDGVRLEKNVDQNQSIARHTGRQLNRGIIMILSIAIVFLLTDRFRQKTLSKPDAESTGIKTAISTSKPDVNDSNKSIAVLPFRDMSAAQDQAYFGEGIAEELLNALVKVEGLDVASRTSAFSLANENLDIPSIAKRLGVATILEGSIRTSGKQVRVTAQLIDVNDDIHLWSETYDGSLDDIFAIQDEITAKIIEAMKVQLGGNSIAITSAELTDNPEAYQLYLQGRHFWRQRSTDSLHESIDLFKQAVELDPEFHRAWSNLAIAYANLPSYDDTVKVDVSYDQAAQAADQALRIDPSNSEALTVKADAAIVECRITEGIGLLERAISSNPTDPTAHHWYALYLAAHGRLEKALEEIQTASRIDPLISAVIATEGDIWRVMGNYQRSETLFNTAASLGFEDGSLYSIALTRAMDGDFSQLENLNSKDRQRFKTLHQLFADAIQNPAKVPALEIYISEQGQPDYFEASEIAELLAVVGSPYLMDYLGGDECVNVPSLVWSDTFKVVRATPEFFHLMDRQGIVDYWREFGWPDDCASLDQSLAECKTP
jgi:TolB-like protein/Flp pilus assembly protein TadD